MQILREKNKMMMRPKRIPTNENLIRLTGKTCLNIAILETERRFFGNKEDIIFDEGRKENDMSLSDWEKDIFLLGKRLFVVELFSVLSKIGLMFKLFLKSLMQTVMTNVNHAIERYQYWHNSKNKTAQTLITMRKVTNKW